MNFNILGVYITQEFQIYVDRLLISLNLPSDIRITYKININKYFVTCTIDLLSIFRLTYLQITILKYLLLESKKRSQLAFFPQTYNFTISINCFSKKSINRYYHFYIYKCMIQFICYNQYIYMEIKTQQIDRMASSSKRHWNNHQNACYLQFLKENQALFDNFKTRKQNKVFLKFSNLIKTRTPIQVKSHHQKLLKRCHSVKSIISYLSEQQEIYGTSMKEFQLYAIEQHSNEANEYGIELFTRQNLQNKGSLAYKTHSSISFMDEQIIFQEMKSSLIKQRQFLYPEISRTIFVSMEDSFDLSYKQQNDFYFQE